VTILTRAKGLASENLFREKSLRGVGGGEKGKKKKRETEVLGR